MEDLPVAYTEHNLPLVLLSGLGGQDEPGNGAKGRPESGTRLVIQTPECEGERAHHLLQQFVNRDGSTSAWNSASMPAPVGAIKYHMKAIGRTHTLPPRKAAPLAQSPSVEDAVNRPRSPSKSTELHSPLSPLSPGSPIYPDGVFTPLWLAKHQQQIPAVFLAFFDIRADDSATSDDQIKADINAVRSSLSRSGFKTRFAAVLLSDKSILHASALEERLASIRRTTNLDSKTGLYFMPPVSSQSEMNAFVQSVLTTLQPSVVEYYRDLTKHARRKKARGSIPATVSATSSQSLSGVGWNARYEFKQGVFAEFRQEMDGAERHYNQALEDLFNSEGVFETTPSWHPRWSEARILSDVLALRIVRCLLWNGLSTSAAKSWSSYRLRMKDLVDRRGKGSQTYGWEAWESRWAKIMAELTRRADLPSYRNQTKQSTEESSDLARLQPYSLPEKAYSLTERLQPFHFLHHAGYWLRLAVNGTKGRWERALMIPEEDRTSPDGSPASSLAKRARAYDTFMVPPPHKEYPSQADDGYDHVDHVAIMAELSEHTAREFTSRGQTRMSEQTKLDLGRDLIKAKRFEEALQQLVPLWEDCTWRDDGWHALYDELLFELHSCATQVGTDAKLILTTTWELLSVTSEANQGRVFDITNCVDDIRTDSDAITVQCKDRQHLSPISVKFAFASKQAFVGEPLECQLSLCSNARAETEPLVLSSIELAIDAMRNVRISHAGDQAAAHVTSLALSTEHDILNSNTNLTLQPKSTRIFNFTLIFREAQAVRLQEAVLSLATEKFTLRHTFQDESLLQTSEWQSEANGELVAASLYRDETTTVEVLPKPPKIKVLLHGIHQQYYVGEQVKLQVEIVNDEVDTVNGSISQATIAQDDIALPSAWSQIDETKVDPATGSTARQDISGLQSSAARKLDLIIDAPTEPIPHTLTIDVDYILASEPATPLKKTIVVELNYVTLFEGKFTFGPLVHPDCWPSYFDPALLAWAQDQPSGIPQRWRVGGTITSVAPDEIVVKGTEMIVDQITNDAEFKVLESSESEDRTLAPNAKFDKSFQISTQKLSLDDRRPTALELSLAITWSRSSDDTLCVTRIPVPRLNIPSSEPRVLCVADTSSKDIADTTLRYHLENPSPHFLTFAVTMEANDDFAFSGPKHSSLSLAPFSRHQLEFNLLVHNNGDETKSDDQGRWIWPVLQVVDTHYQQKLRVQAAGPGVRVDPQRGMGVWVATSKA